ncbi:hypothetical protein [uncultured Leifsonia sp.]|uniref:hypothetical protein n=1 Tax=uncultured Leifsonia sp. TaxID=340359 RepID=UPI0028D4E436|nr:hypothetical protein [uncultured Leifsonia sp.]
MTRAERKQAVAELQAIAKRFDDAADRAFTLADEEQRRRDAATLRMVAVLVSAPRIRHLSRDAEYVKLWMDAAERMLAHYDRADMDVVHGSRMIRREARAQQLAAEAGR